MAHPFSRRRFLAATLACAVPSRALSFPQIGPRAHGALTKDERDRMTPGQVIDALKRGNERFRSEKMSTHDYRAQRTSSANGQYPAAVILGCIDSRAPAEIVFDAGIGDLFNARVAGNILNDDLLGSLEFACAVAGAKVVALLGHTSCGAVKGAIDDVELGKLTGLLARIKPAVSATHFEGETSSKNPAYVDAVARTNVLLTLESIRQQSPTLANLEHEGRIQMVGAMYDVRTGVTEFFDARR